MMDVKVRARTALIEKTANLMSEMCRESGIPYDVFVQATVLNYRGVKVSSPELVRQIELVCDQVDKERANKKSNSV